jgi:hypothetical protein
MTVGRSVLAGATLLMIGTRMTSGCAPVPADDCTSLHNCPLEGGDTGSVVHDDAEIDAGAGADSPAGDAAACDPVRSPSEDPCVIDEMFGVFVSPLGSDGNAGTRASPLMTVGHGIDLAKATGKRVYVCAGTFPEALVVGAPRDGIAVYGGFDCGTWTYSATNRVAIAPPQTGYALELDGLSRGATFTDIEFDAQRANLANPGESSIAVFVSGSQNVNFQRVAMVAANATDGAAGPSAQAHGDGGGGATNWYGTPPAYAELNGNNATSAGAGAQRACVCADNTSSIGGAGGVGPVDGGPAPGPGLPSYPNDAGAGLGGRNGVQCVEGAGLAGADAPPLSSGIPSASWGSVSATGWTPASGTAGSSGQPGQGGGGGGDGPGATGGGGSGACGGCGGAGGKGGTGGGSSIALLSFQSAVGLNDCTLTASNAGRGGAGGDGEAGQPGSLVGGIQSASGCPGGGGGSGTGGNGGQGGPGGLSLGIGYSGTAPLFDGSGVAPGQSLARVVTGAAGAAGTPGLAGLPATTNVGQPQPGAAGPLGAPGLAQPVLSL